MYHERRLLYQIIKHESIEICKEMGNRKLKLTKNGKWAVHLQMLERGGKKGLSLCPKNVCKSE